MGLRDGLKSSLNYQISNQDKLNALPKDLIVTRSLPEDLLSLVDVPRSSSILAVTAHVDLRPFYCSFFVSPLKGFEPSVFVLKSHV